MPMNLRPSSDFCCQTPVLLGDLMIGVGQDRKVELELVGELLADAEYRGLALLELRQAVTKVAGLFRTARRVVFRIVEDHLSPSSMSP